MNSTDHACLRYAERIMNLEGSQAKQYARFYKDNIRSYIERTHAHARFLWRGQLGTNQVRNFYLRDDIILITDQYDHCVITLYRADYGFSQSTNRQFVKELLELIKHKEDLLTKTKDKRKAAQIQHEIEDCSIKIINSIEYRIELEQVS